MSGMQTGMLEASGTRGAGETGSDMFMHGMCIKERSSRMNENQTCKTCIDNDNGFCDRKGILIEEDDSCESHSSDHRNSVEKRITERKRE